MLLVLTLLFVEGTEEEKMETDTDVQQPEKVKSVWILPRQKSHREHAFHGIMVWVCFELLVPLRGL